MDAILPKKNTARSPRRKVMVGVAWTAGLSLGIALWYRAINILPIVSIPTQTMPAHNAFDDFVAASKAIIGGNKTDYAIEDNHPPHSSDPNYRNYSLAEKAALVSANAEPLRRLRAGFAYPYLTIGASLKSSHRLKNVEGPTTTFLERADDYP